MIADPTYSKRVQLCIRCPYGSRRTGACMEDKRQFHEHAVSGECPKLIYGLGLPARMSDYVPTPTNATEGGCGCKK
jgi:hypothetical protein